MNKLLNLSAIAVAFFVLSTIVSAQEGGTTPSAKEVFRKYAEAVGGKSAEKITSRVVKGTVEIKSAGITGTFEIFSKTPDKSLLSMNLTGLGAILDGYDGKESWASDPLQGMRTKEGEELAQTKATADFYYDINFEKHYPNAAVTGTEKVGETDAYVVKADDVTTLYFDKQTGFMVRSDRITTSPQGKIPVQVFQTDFRDVDGIKQAFSIRQVAAGMELTFKVEEIKQNVAIDDAKFAKPK